MRSYDRIHSIALRNLNVDYELRETLESGLLFGRRTLEALGVGEADAYEIGEDIRKRDEQRAGAAGQRGPAGRAATCCSPAGPAGAARQAKARAGTFDEDPLSEITAMYGREASTALTICNRRIPHISQTHTQHARSIDRAHISVRP